MATLSDIRSRIRSLTAIESTAVLPDAQIDVFISEAQQSILHDCDWPFLTEAVSVSVATGSDSVVVPVSRESHRVRDVFARYVDHEKPWQLFDRGAPFVAEDADGHSTEFSWDAGSSTLSLWPAPASDIVVYVRFVLSVPVVSSDADIIVPDEFVHAVSYLAASNILVREADESDRSQRFAAESYAVRTQMRKVLMTSSRGSFVVGKRQVGRRVRRRGAW